MWICVTHNDSCLCNKDFSPNCTHREKVKGPIPKRLKTAENKLTIGRGAGETCFSGLKLTTRERQSVKIQEL